MASLYTTILTVALVLVMVAAGRLMKSPDPAPIWAGMVVKALCALAAFALAVHSARSRLWVDLALTALLLLGIALDWDVTLSRLTGRLPRFTLWMAGYRWGSSTNDRRPPS